MQTCKQSGSGRSSLPAISRRTFLRRSGATIASAAGAGWLLSACGGGSSSPSTAAASSAAGLPSAAAIPNTTAATPSPTIAASPAAATPAAATTNTTTATSGTAKRGGTLTVQGNQEISSLHPDDAGPLVHWVIVANIHDPLLDTDVNYELQPILADKYQVSSDGLTYTFNLHKGVKFHDGQEFTATDVKYTYEWYADPANAAVNGANFAGLDTIDMPDEYTVVVKRKTVDASFLIRGGTTMIMPQHYHSQVGKKGYAAKPIATGPFKLKEWIAAQKTTLEAFDDYFRGRPNIDVYIETNVPEESVRTIALQTGESDNSVWPLTAEQNLQLSQDPRFNILRAQNIAVNHFPLNNDKPALAEKEVRQAMLYALNRDSMVKDLEKGLAVKATANLAPALKFWYEPNVQDYPYDANKAKAILDQAGWKPGADGVRAKNGTRLSFTCTIISGDERNRSKAVVAQANLQAVGIDMKINEQPVAAIIDGLVKGDLDASIFNWTYGGSGGDPDGRTSLRSDGARNFSHYKNPEMDKLLDSGVATISPDDRKTYYSQIQKLVADDVPFLYVMFWDWIEVWNKRVHGVPSSAANLSAPYRLIYKYWLG